MHAVFGIQSDDMRLDVLNKIVRWMIRKGEMPSVIYNTMLLDSNILVNFDTRFRYNIEFKHFANMDSCDVTKYLNGSSDSSDSSDSSSSSSSSSSSDSSGHSNATPTALTPAQVEGLHYNVNLDTDFWNVITATNRFTVRLDYLVKSNVVDFKLLDIDKMSSSTIYACHRRTTEFWNNYRRHHLYRDDFYKYSQNPYGDLQFIVVNTDSVFWEHICRNNRLLTKEFLYANFDHIVWECLCENWYVDISFFEENTTLLTKEILDHYKVTAKIAKPFITGATASLREFDDYDMSSLVWNILESKACFECIPADRKIPLSDLTMRLLSANVWLTDEVAELYADDLEWCQVANTSVTLDLLWRHIDKCDEMSLRYRINRALNNQPRYIYDCYGNDMKDAPMPM
tara:strand:- start:4929 stop:6125 length:1197 start_codon:yes stop_codon:yes gene_type:complete